MNDMRINAWRTVENCLWILYTHTHSVLVRALINAARKILLEAKETEQKLSGGQSQ